MLPSRFTLLNKKSHSMGIKTKPPIQHHSCFNCGGQETEMEFARAGLKQLVTVCLMSVYASYRCCARWYI